MNTLDLKSILSRLARSGGINPRISVLLHEDFDKLLFDSHTIAFSRSGEFYATARRTEGEDGQGWIARDKSYREWRTLVQKTLSARCVLQFTNEPGVCRSRGTFTAVTLSADCRQTDSSQWLPVDIRFRHTDSRPFYLRPRVPLLLLLLLPLLPLLPLDLQKRRTQRGEISSFIAWKTRTFLSVLR